MGCECNTNELIAELRTQTAAISALAEAVASLADVVAGGQEQPEAQGITMLDGSVLG